MHLCRAHKHRAHKHKAHQEMSAEHRTWLCAPYLPTVKVHISPKASDLMALPFQPQQDLCRQLSLPRSSEKY